MHQAVDTLSWTFEVRPLSRTCDVRPPLNNNQLQNFRLVRQAASSRRNLPKSTFVEEVLRNRGSRYIYFLKSRAVTDRIIIIISVFVPCLLSQIPRTLASGSTLRQPRPRAWWRLHLINNNAFQTISTLRRPRPTTQDLGAASSRPNTSRLSSFFLNATGLGPGSRVNDTFISNIFDGPGPRPGQRSFFDRHDDEPNKFVTTSRRLFRRRVGPRSVFGNNPKLIVATFRLFSTSRQLGPRAWWLQFLTHFERFRRCVCPAASVIKNGHTHTHTHNTDYTNKIPPNFPSFFDVMSARAQGMVVAAISNAF